jgi:hypothetical protein
MDPTSLCTRRALWATRLRLVEKTIFGIGFQIRANSRIASVAAGSVSPSASSPPSARTSAGEDGNLVGRASGIFVLLLS